MSNFVHLHLHSGFSLLDGACDHDTLAKTARNTKCRPLPSPIMEICSARSAFTKPRRKPASSRSSAARCTSRRRTDMDRDPASGRPNHLIVLCENEKGYQNLVKLVSKGYLEGFYYKPRIDKDLLARAQRRTDRPFGLPEWRSLRQCSGRTCRAGGEGGCRISGHFRQRPVLSRNPRSRSGETAQDHSRHAAHSASAPAFESRRRTTATTWSRTIAARTTFCCASRPARPSTIRTA